MRANRLPWGAGKRANTEDATFDEGVPLSDQSGIPGNFEKMAAFPKGQEPSVLLLKIDLHLR
jgi:hypothetical protein